MSAQLELFAFRPTNDEQAALMRRLESAVRGGPAPPGRMSRAALRRLMTPLPPITVPGWGRRA